MGLTDAGRSALEAILGGEEAWSMTADLERRDHGLATLQALEADGWVVPWVHPDGLAWTLTPWAVERLSVEASEAIEIEERITVVEGEEFEDANGNKMRLREIVETPHWAKGVHPDRPIRLPRYGQEYQLLYPELVPDPTPEPVEPPEVPAEVPMTLFKQGFPVVVDRRLGPKRAG